MSVLLVRLRHLNVILACVNHDKLACSAVFRLVSLCVCKICCISGAKHKVQTARGLAVSDLCVAVSPGSCGTHPFEAG